MIPWPPLRLLASSPWRCSLCVPSPLRLVAENTPLTLPRARAPTRSLPGTTPAYPSRSPVRTLVTGPESPLDIQERHANGPD
jgi:hypothetical protein